ncbi:MAG: hypothetical protein QOE30_5179 [Mycobacterium sp.]|jgi:hypothetical protein|uniref:hypothetical protein n=1 Tax=Mycobacterium sp. TaxID=1785 RepID=UPI0028B8DC38|nr:hypothetical protein [Mycobacterium sp.]MDT5119440.1 hypothetical protein [Mycobacterium sp.]
MGAPRTLDARASVAWLRRFARTTPGVVSVIAVVVAACCVLAGLVCGGQLDGRIAEHNAVLDRSEPLAYSAQKLYAALSAADAAAASAFLSGGIETVAMRTRYKQALADAASALADVTAGTTDVQARTRVAEMSAKLAAYTGLVETARANDRQGFVIGSAYLREASTMMQTALLPGAEEIYSGDLTTLNDDQRAVGSLPTISLVLLGLVLAAIVVGSMILVRRTNRQFNLGLIVAAAAVLLVIGWIIVATRLAAGNIEHSQTQGTARFEHLAKARILAQQARTDETLQLIARGDITDREKSFAGHMDEVTALLGTGPQAAADAVAKWRASHRKQVEAYEAGDYDVAVAQAIGPDPDASAAQFDAVERSLRTEIEQTRATLRDRVSAAGARLAWSPTGTLVLMVVGAVLTVVGLWPRLKEFL